MQTFRRIFRKATWLALVAMLGLALAPTISHALAASGPGNPWTEVCSVAGGTAVAASADAAGQDAAGGVHLGHCPLCGHLSHALSLPPAEPSGAALPGGADQRPALFTPSPRPLFAWAAAQPRAPPASC